MTAISQVRRWARRLGPQVRYDVSQNAFRLHYDIPLFSSYLRYDASLWCLRPSSPINLTTRRSFVNTNNTTVKYLSTSSIDEKGIITSPHRDVDISVLPVTEYIFQNSINWPNRSALIDGVTGQVLTYSELKEAIWRAAGGLSRHGFERYDVLLLLCSDSPQLIIMVQAALLLGGAVSPCPPLSSHDVVSRQLQDCHASFIYTDTKSKHTAMAASMLSGKVKKIFIDGSSPNMTSLQDMLADDCSAFPSHVTFNPTSDVAVVPYSAGIWGLSKPVRLTHRNIVANVQQISATCGMSAEHGVTLTTQPLHHMSGLLMSAFVSLAMGHTTCILPSSDPHSLLHVLHTREVSFLHTTPNVLHNLLTCQSRTDTHLSLRRVLVGGAYVSGWGHEILRSMCPDVQILQVYSLTESAGVLAITPPVPAQPSSHILLPNTRLKVVSLLDATTCPRGVTGEFWVAGPQITPGYVNESGEVSSDGWLRTGDTGYLDNQGYIQLTGRCKAVIKCDGLQVSLVELEDVLRRHPAVHDVVVLGIPGHQSGQLARAHVVFNQGSHFTFEQLDEYVTRNLAPHKSLRGGIEIVTEIPNNIRIQSGRNRKSSK